MRIWGAWVMGSRSALLFEDVVRSEAVLLSEAASPLEATPLEAVIPPKAGIHASD